MNNEYLKEGFKVIGDWSKAFYEKNKAHIYTGLGVGGTIATGVLSARSGAKSAREIDRKSNELKRPLTVKEKVQLCWRNYAWPVVIGGLTCASDLKSDITNTKVIAERTALLLSSEKAYETLSRKTKEVLGEKKARQVQDEVAKETAQQMESAGAFSVQCMENAPRVGSGTLYPYVDGYSKLLFWSNPDCIALIVKTLNEMMRDIPARGDDFDYMDRRVGVAYAEWLKSVGFPNKVWNTPERRRTGWNKGYAKDGSDDDPIDYFITSETLESGMPVNVITWEKDPIDMSLGRMIKSNGL